MCNQVGMHDLTMWRGGDAHFHCNLTRRTGVGGGATPDLESAQWAVQSMRKAMDESKDRLALISCSSWWFRGSKGQGTSLAGPTKRPWVMSHQSEKDSVSSRI